MAHYATAFTAKKADIYMMVGDTAKAREVLNGALTEAKKSVPADVLTVEALEAKLKLLPQ